eukprot:11670103-Karenia_brevis.AAC.1
MHFPPPPPWLPLGLLRRVVKKGRLHKISEGLRTKAIAWLFDSIQRFTKLRLQKLSPGRGLARIVSMLDDIEGSLYLPDSD